MCCVDYISNFISFKSSPNPRVITWCIKSISLVKHPVYEHGMLILEKLFIARPCLKIKMFFFQVVAIVSF